MLHMAAQNSFILFKKCMTNQNQKDKSYTSIAFILDCSENDSARKNKMRKIAQTMNH
jgi:hypothetical protein